MKRLSITALTAAFAIVLAAGSAHGADGQKAPDLRVERAEGADACPDPKAFTARVREGLSGPHDHAQTASGRTITVRFERTRSGYASAVRTSDGMERALDDRAGAGCDGLAEATLLAVRLAFDVPQSSAISEDEPSKDVRRDERPTTPTTPAADGHKTHPEILVGGLSTIGVMQDFAPGGRAAVAVSVGGEALWTLGVTGSMLAPQTQSIGVGKVEIGLLGGGFEVCRRHRFEGASLLLGLCGRAEIARLSGQAQGFVRNEEASRPLFSGSLLLRGQRRLLGPVGLFAEVGGVVPIIRERFEIQGVGVVHDPPVMGGTAALGALIDFE